MKKRKSILAFSGIVILSVLLGITVRNLIVLASSFNASSPIMTFPRSLSYAAKNPESSDVVTSDNFPEGEYEVFTEEKLTSRFVTYEEALDFAQSRERSFIRRKDKSKWLWDNFPPYVVYTDSESYLEFESYAESAAFAKAQKKAFILYRKDNAVVWDSGNRLLGSAKIDVLHISQLPELPRGCEVTSLAMLLQHKGVAVDKLELAEKITKDETPHQIIKGQIYYGNPNDGFVGDIYSLLGPGLGVYHRPIHELMSQYLPYASLDLTGCDFEDLFYFLEAGSPVWVIIHSAYDTLPASNFLTWHTASGPIQITYKEHSVLVTGYDSRYIYFNDPLGGAAKVPLSGFQKAWEQMGRQAITCTP